ncbi:hypothetical protein DL93DRAFT_1360849 [Clavulina sp. PMI_390]|nr:hypothetical protein DL93DRAFT_1360849 [Clavulina sp. PMI_390]
MSISTTSSTSTVNAPVLAHTIPTTVSKSPPTLNASSMRPPQSSQRSKNNTSSRPRRPSNNEIDSSEPESESETNSDSDSNATPAPAKSNPNTQLQSRPSTSRSQPSPVMDFDDPDEFIRASASSRRTHRTTTTSNSTSGDTQDDDATADVDADAETSAAGAKKKPPRAPRKKKVVVASASARDDTIGASGSGDGSDLLWSKWLSAAELKKLREEQGVVMKEGKFSQAESDIVHGAMTKYATEQGLDWDRLKELVNAKRGSKGALEESFWPDIARQLPGRSLLSVYQFVKRKYNPLRSQGPWTIEEDVLLRSAVLNYGTLWQQVGAQVGRTAEDCRDRYRNHVAYGDGRVKGDWTEVEEQKLVGIILDLAKAKGEDLATITGDVDIPWVVVSERMGGVRTRQQCRIKWQEYLCKRKFMWETVQKNHSTQSLGEGNSASGREQRREGPGEGEQSQLALRKAKLKPRRWSAAERKKLIEELTTHPAQHESEIQWKVIVSQAGWNGVWSAQDLQKRWITLKRSVLGWETLSFRDVVRELATRPLEIPKSAVLSKPTIDTDDEVDTNDGETE